MEENGTKSIAAGNIGVSLSEAIAEGIDDDTTIFLEVSSFQSGTMRKLNPNFLSGRILPRIIWMFMIQKRIILQRRLICFPVPEKIWVGSR